MDEKLISGRQLAWAFPSIKLNSVQKVGWFLKGQPLTKTKILSNNFSNNKDDMTKDAGKSEEESDIDDDKK